MFDIKNIKKSKLFIDTTIELIKEIGIENISIRKIAKKLNMNTANIYYHFDNFDHLLGVASIYFLQEYVIDVSNKIKNAKTHLDEYFILWENFIYYSFKSPSIYNKIFFSKKNSSKNLIEEFYYIFPEYKKQLNDNFLDIFLKEDIYERNLVLLIKIFSVENIELAKTINEIHLLLFKALLNENHNTQVNSQKMLNFLKYTLFPYIEKKGAN